MSTNVLSWGKNKKQLISHHFEHGFGMMDIYSPPKTCEKDNITSFPMLDEYLIGINFKTKYVNFEPVIGIFEKSYDIRYNKKRIAKSYYMFSGGIIINYNSFKLKITNTGFSFGITF